MTNDLPFQHKTPASAPGSPTIAAPIPQSLSQAIRLPTLDRMFLLSLCMASVGFFVVSYMISLDDPEYFSRQAIAALPVSAVDPINTGAIVDVPTAMPAPQIVRVKPPFPADFQIVMVFDSEAILATSEELWRVKVGSVVPGLGEILTIEERGTGGMVKAKQATLETAAR
ncbi:MAG: hypothetical protein H7Y08_01555 [Rhizobiaceae bacterium]|nr:hypothetical protein [Rhizobiaceae bacterium]